jgi:hypothetical protein
VRSSIEPLDAGSPLRLPLVRQMLSDPTVAIRARAIDGRWHEQGLIGSAMGGFNPFHGTIFHARRTGLDAWLADPTRSARPHNLRDGLVRPLLFAVHDYIHVWATRLVQRLAPGLGFGAGRVTRANFDDQLFAMLLTEAAATAAVDYWWLCTIDLAEELPVGTRLRDGITTPYHERQVAELRRFHPELEVQSPAFFADLCAFYCSGEFLGFDADDVARSAVLHAWLEKEIRYGEKQREICRAWLAYLAHDDVVIPADRLADPVDADTPDRRALVEAVGEALWRKVKLDELQPLAASAEEPFASPADRRPDLRFCNLNTLDDARAFAPRAFSAEEFEHLLAQAVSRCDLDRFDRELVKLFPVLREKRDAPLLRALVRGQPRVEGAAGEPRDLLVLS